MQFQIYGHSDDCLEFEGDVYGEVGCYDSPVVVRIGTKEACVFVTCEYAPSWQQAGVWCLTPHLMEEDVSWPEGVTIEVKPKHAYSTALHVTAPDGTPVKVKRDGEWADIE